MTKTELVAKIAEETGVTKAVADTVIKSSIGIITEAMKSGDDVSFVGFGTFSSVDKPERTGKNPSTGEPITIAAHKAAKFKAGKALKDALNS